MGDCFSLYASWKDMKWLRILFLLTLVGCYKHQAEFYFLSLGKLIQGAYQINLLKRSIDTSWQARMKIEHKEKSYCLLMRSAKEVTKFVLLQGSQCSLDGKVLWQWSSPGVWEFQGENNIIRVKHNKKNKYNWYYFRLPVLVKRKFSTVNCGKRNQSACYRGSGYKPQVDNSCTTENEQYFCQVGLTLYCQNDHFVCL